jgi:parallel beta helix pectate lyase-like protein
MLDRMQRLMMFSALGLALSSAHPAPFVPASQPCGAVATFADGRTPLEIRHVSLKGNDTDGVGSATRPFRTIARAARSISPGTAIYLHAGTYPGGTFLTALRGTAAQPIWIVGAPGEARPVIAGGSQGLYLTRPSYVVLQNFEVRDTADNGINVDDAEEVANPEAAHSVLFRDLDIHDTGKQPSGVANCLKMAGVNDFLILGSSFARCGNGPGSGAVGVDGVGVHRGRVSFNRFIANGFGGIQFKGASRDIEIRSNFFQNTGWRGVNMGGSTGEPFFRPPLAASTLNYEAARIQVVANVFDGSEAAAAFAGCLDCQFNHNTVINPSKWVLRILQETLTIGRYTFARAGNGVVAGNIFYFRRADLNAGEDINVGTDTDPRSFSLIRNLWYAHDSPAQSSPRLPLLRGNRTGELVGTAPSFVDARAGNFHLEANSAARAAGGVQFASGSDFAGECYATPPSLGALELTGTRR